MLYSNKKINSFECFKKEFALSAKDLAEQGLGKGKKKYWSSRGLRLPAVEYSSLDLGAGLEPDYENDICFVYNINPSEL